MLRPQADDRIKHLEREKKRSTEAEDKLQRNRILRDINKFVHKNRTNLFKAEY